MAEVAARHINLDGKRFGIFIRHGRIIKSIDRIALRIGEDYGDGSKGVPLFLGVLNGSFMFFAELMQRLSFPCEVSFVRFSSYRGTSSTGSVREIIGLEENISGRHIIIVEDVVDTGRTLESLAGRLSSMHPASIETATLLLKPSSYRKEVPVKYAAMEVPDDFIIGFGMDYNGLGRNLKHLYVIEDEKK